MKKSLSLWQLWGFVFTGVFGVLLHFLYEWTGQNLFVALFSPVNESIWEHLKLLFFPMLIFALLESRYIGKDFHSFWCVKLIGILRGIILVPTIYYTVNGSFGTTPDWVNIAIFFVAVAFSYYTETRLLKKNTVQCRSPKTAVFILCLTAVLFMVFTFATPQIPLFIDPISNTYGI